MNNDLIFEIGTEELPNSFLNYINQNYSKLIEESLKEHRLSYKLIETYSTPRRLLVFVHDLSVKQPDIVIEKQGPPYKIFYHDNQLTETGKKFLKSQHLTEKDISIKETKKGKYIYTSIKTKGKLTIDILQEIIDLLFKKIHLSKSMKWDSSQLEFIRPIRWIAAVFQGKQINIKIGNITSGSTSFGHRFLSSNKKIKLENIEQAKKTLYEHFIMFDSEKRKIHIKNNIKKLLQSGYTCLQNNELLDEVSNLVEFPFIQLCEFDSKFLNIPSEFISTAIIHHQRAFPVYFKNKITNKFFVILNNKPNLNTKQGNERVLKARLNDAEFFVNEDRKEGKLETQNEKLKNMLFLKDLGTLYDKVSRMIELSDYMSALLKLDSSLKASILQTAKLSKSDLATSIVYEFPELQGIAGMIYAKQDGESIEVVKGINQHYMPRNAGDKYPEQLTGIIVGLADKIDHITGCFIKGFIPTGSEDPYQIRRFSLAIINLILNNKFQIDIKSLFEYSYKTYYEQKLIKNKEDIEIIKQIILYIKNRYKTILLENEYIYDEIDSILNLNNNDNNIFDLSLRVKELKYFRKNKKFKDLLIALKRMANIIKGIPLKVHFKESLLKEKEEKELYNIFRQNISPFNNYIKEKKYQDAFKLLSGYKEPVDRFFDEVLVMDKNTDLKNNRLALLNTMVEHFRQLLDFSCFSEKS